ncbi:MAG: N-6 DNA methylase [Bryobacterales bacterium]|nr:N-6 DNA methylase [Bryobacterales bacterium]
MSAPLLSAYASVRTEGALLPADILVRIAAGDTSFGGLDPASYHLDPSEKIGEATNRAWNRLQARWATFQTERAKLAPTDTGTSITRDRWLLPLFEELKFGRLQLATKIEIDGKSYAVSHSWQHVPIHLVGCHVELDRRVVVAGAQRSSPHSLSQELLNRSSGHLWGVVSNGLRLRLLRDNISLTRQAYVEFDLEAMMVGEAYPDFVLLWLILHQSRFEGERPELCQLEKWSQAARTEGVRVLDGLRDGVQRAIEHLGQGFLAHPSNAALRERLRSGALDKQDYYRQLLRLVYRLLFLFVAEDRDLLVVPTANPAAQKRYRHHYATTRLRRLATTRAGSRHHDLYCALKLVMEKLSCDGCPELALPALGSFLFSAGALPELNGCEISNLHLLESIRSLAVTQTGQSRRVVDYKNLGAGELGSVYESLLELHPDLNAEAAAFELKVAAGSERKKTGSYYTPTSLISCLLDSALDPVLDEATKLSEPEAAILKLKVVDPACGSGHFLIAAAHRIAKRLAAVRTGEEEPPPEAQRKALRDVIGHCIYGVDVNPMAVELCKVSLWMEALEPGKPLSFLEHRISAATAYSGRHLRYCHKAFPMLPSRR